MHTQIYFSNGSTDKVMELSKPEHNSVREVSIFSKSTTVS